MHERSRNRQSQEQAPARPRTPERPQLHRLLALQQSAGNHAVSRMLARELAIEPKHPGATGALSDEQVADALKFNQASITDAGEIEMLRDIVGLEVAPAELDEAFVRAVADYQAGLGIPVDGKIGGVTRRRLSFEILAEARTIGNGSLGSLASGMQLHRVISGLLGGGGTPFGTIRARILGATLQQRDVVLADTALLTRMRDGLTWDEFARCVELLGRSAPAFNDLITRTEVRNALASAWRDSTPALNPPGGTQHEEGGWVFLNLITNALTVQRQAAGATAAINLSAPPAVADSIVVAKFHTHPNLGPGWDPAPSAGDAAVDAVHGVPDIVVGTPGVDPTQFQTFLSGPVRRLHLAGGQGFPVPAAGVAPQARKDGTEGDGEGQ